MRVVKTNSQGIISAAANSGTHSLSRRKVKNSEGVVHCRQIYRLNGKDVHSSKYAWFFIEQRLVFSTNNRFNRQYYANA